MIFFIFPCQEMLAASTTGGTTTIWRTVGTSTTWDTGSRPPSGLTSPGAAASPSPSPGAAPEAVRLHVAGHVPRAGDGSLHSLLHGQVGA